MNHPARPSQRSQQRESTRRHFVEAGLRVVAAEGFAGATTAAIAQATGKAHGTVFLHFRTRDELVAELVAEVGRTMSAQLIALETETPTLADVLSAHLTALHDHEVLYSRLLGEAATLPLAARAHLFALQSGVASRLRAAYERARALGEVRELDPVAFSNIWISLTNHYLQHRELFAPGDSVVTQCGASIQSQFLSLVRI